MSARPVSARPVLVGIVCALTAGAALLPAGGAAAAPAPAAGCADVRIVSARGTNEPGTVGQVQQVADKVAAGTRRTVEVFGLPYPASMDMSASALAGDRMLGDDVNRAVAKCPQQKQVLLGYSQGAWVVGDALTGGATLSGTTGATISPRAGRNVAAVVLFGDPRFTAGETFNRGTFAAGREGNYPRPIGTYGSYSQRIRSYCDGTDQTCQNVAGLGHLGYWPKYNDDAANFILRRLGPKAAPSSPSSPSPAGGSEKPRPSTGLSPELRKQVDETVAQIMRDAATPGDAPGGVVATPGTTSPTTPAAAPAQKPEKHWWNTVAGWLNPFD